MGISVGIAEGQAMSEASRRLQDPIARDAFNRWRIKNPHGSVDDFLHRKRHAHAPGATLRKKIKRAVERSTDPSLPEKIREFARQDLVRLRQLMGTAP
jgi:hypothetical protein